jgi:ABC-type glycerol-3-phosphate transport system substrate-binding protein
MFVAGTPPDVLGNYGGGFGSFIVNNSLLDITPYANRQKFDLKTFEPAALNAIRRGGKLYGLPVAHNPWLLYHNRSLLQERGAALPPTNWKDKRWNLDALLKAGQQVTTATGDPSTATWGIVHPAGQMGTQACWLWGIDPYGTAGPDKTTAYQTGKITDVNYLQPRVVEALQTIEQDLAFKYKVAPSPTDQTPFVAGRPTPLHTGRLGFWAGGGWLIQNFKVGDVAFKWGVAPLAYGLGTSASNTTGLFNDSFHVANGTKVPDAAFLLVSHIATGDRARGYTEGGGHFPANRAGYDAWYEETLKIPRFGMTRAELQEVMQGALEGGFPSPGKTIHRQRDFESAYGKAIAPVRNGQQPASVALRDVQQQIEAVSRQG